MAGTERIAELESALREAQQELKEQKDEFERAKEEADRKLTQQRDDAKEKEGELFERLKAVETELDNSMLSAEVEKLRAVEKAREEERDRSQKWIENLREGFRAEKRSLEEKIARLEAGTASRVTSTPTGGGMDSSDPHTSASTVASPATRPATTAVSTSVTTASSTPLTSTSPSTAAVLSTATTTSVTSSLATGTSTTVSTPVLPSIGSAEMIVKLFETQSQIAAQVQAATLPSLASFDGQIDSDELEFERWLERFEERARLAKWTQETKLCQLKLHLSNSTLTLQLWTGPARYSSAQYGKIKRVNASRAVPNRIVPARFALPCRMARCGTARLV